MKLTKEKNKKKTITGVMTQEEKELLLRDLCARLTYGVKCRFETTVDTYETIELSREGTNGLLVDFDEIHCYWFNEGFIIPYLRPMSSMTEEEKEIYKRFCDEDIRQLTYVQEVHPSLKQKTSGYRSIDWLNAHHFDYRGLIERGLAIEAPRGMYN